jgi:hypothetical protein
MFIEMRVYCKMDIGFRKFFLYDPDKMVFSFKYKDAYFESPSYLQSHLPYLTFYSSKNSIKDSSDLQVKEICDFVTRSLACCAEVLITPDFHYYSECGMSARPFDAKDKSSLMWKLSNGFSKNMDIQREANQFDC